MAMAIEAANPNISEFDKTVSMLENMTDEELQALRKVAMVITKRNADDRPIRKLTEEEFFLKVDEGIADVEAGKYLIKHDPKVLPDMHIYLTEAQRLKSELQNIEGLMVMDTFTHYMLVNIDWATSLELKNWLMEHHGILIRDASNFHGLDDHCFRVAAQMPDENDALISAIKEFKTSR